MDLSPTARRHRCRGRLGRPECRRQPEKGTRHVTSNHHFARRIGHHRHRICWHCFNRRVSISRWCRTRWCLSWRRLPWWLLPWCTPGRGGWHRCCCGWCCRRRRCCCGRLLRRARLLRRCAGRLSIRLLLLCPLQPLRTHAIIITAVSGILDRPPQCAIAHDDGRIHLRILAARCTRGLLEVYPPEFGGRRECRAPAGTRGLVCKMHSRMRTRAYRYSRSSPAFPAQWFYGLCRALPGDEFLLPPSPAN